jgi:hypothetical protein
VRIDLKYDEGLFNCGLGVQRPSRPHDFALARFRGSTSSMNRHAGENLMQPIRSGTGKAQPVPQKASSEP